MAARPHRSARARIWIAGAALVLAACGSRTASQWRAAEEAWHTGDSASAYPLWLAIDPRSPEGVEARRRLADADRDYRLVIEHLRTGEPDVRQAVARAKAEGPMDPRLFLPLARACRERGYLARAEEFYTKYLAALPGGVEAAAARAELSALAPGQDPFDDAGADRGAPAVSRIAPVAWLAVAGGLAALVAAALAVWRGRGPAGRSLAEVAAASPELHPTIAYLVGCWRHELLKHRVGAVASAVRALASGDDQPAARAFLVDRLYGGEPIEAAWRDHLRGLERALGLGSLERADRSIRRASRAIHDIAALRPAWLRADPTAPARLLGAHEELRRFDRGLARLAANLSRSSVDEALVREAVEAVRAEYEAGAVVLDELRVGPLPPDVVVEVCRVDLRIILKNVVRNAIVAVGREPGPRRVAIDALVAVEPTGEETVRIRVRDTSRDSLTTEAIYGRRVERGLGLVTAALDRYHGAIEVEPATEGYAKSVTVRLFRALDGEAAPDAISEAA